MRKPSCGRKEQVITPEQFAGLLARYKDQEFRDLLTVQGTYNPKQKLPLIPASDGAGEVVETGEGVTRVRPGDRVCTLFAQRWIAGSASAT